MQTINPDLILGRLQAGTLLRHEWGDGHKRACLLAALAPECAEDRRASVCPASVMPRWLAELTPFMDDSGTGAAWEPFVRRYAAVAARWHVLNEAAWRRAFLGSLTAILEVAREHAPLGSCDRVIALCREGASADDPRWKDADAAATTADAEEAVWAVWAATYAAWAAKAADAAAEAAAAKAAAKWAAVAAAEAVWEAVWDRMTAGILAAIEAECDRAEAP